MHTIRIKELKGKSWVELSQDAFIHKDVAEIAFMNVINAYVNDWQSGISITWSEGKKVHGSFIIR